MGEGALRVSENFNVLSIANYYILDMKLIDFKKMYMCACVTCVIFSKTSSSNCRSNFKMCVLNLLVFVLQFKFIIKLSSLLSKYLYQMFNESSNWDILKYQKYSIRDISNCDGDHNVTSSINKLAGRQCFYLYICVYLHKQFRFKVIPCYEECAASLFCG